MTELQRHLKPAWRVEAAELSALSTGAPARGVLLFWLVLERVLLGAGLTPELFLWLPAAGIPSLPAALR